MNIKVTNGASNYNANEIYFSAISEIITAYDICHSKMDINFDVTRIKMHFTQNPSSIWYQENISIKFILLFMDRCKKLKERKIYVIAHVTLKSQIMYTVVQLRHVSDIYHPDKEKRDYNRQSSRKLGIWNRTHKVIRKTNDKHKRTWFHRLSNVIFVKLLS